MNMTSSVTNWWSGNDKKLDSKEEKKTEEKIGVTNNDNTDVNKPPHPAMETEPILKKPGDSLKQQSEESPLTSEADSVSNQSEVGESEVDDPENTGRSENEKTKSFGEGIQVGINEVSTKAIESAKNFGSK